MQTDTITLRELTIRYSVKADTEGQPICVGRTLSKPADSAAVLMALRQRPADDQMRADLAAAVQAAIVDVLVAKALAALERTGLQELVVAGGVGANGRLRAQLSKQAERHGYTVRYPELQFCTDNGAMIAFAGALRLQHAPDRANGFTVRARWELEELTPVGQAAE